MGGSKRWLCLVACWSCGCGPVVGVGEADDGTSTGETGRDSGDPVTLTGVSSVPPQSEVSTLASETDDPSLDGAGEFDVFADTAGPSCPQVFEVQALPAAITVLVDASQTMGTSVDHDFDPDTPSITRWNLVADTLAAHAPALVELGSVELVAFPAVDAEAPPSPLACADPGPYGQFSSDADALLASMPSADATFFQGATPTASALTSALIDLQSFDPRTRRSIVVLTDGAPNCGLALAPPELFTEVDIDATVRAAEAWAEGIAVHVVGVDVPEGSYGGGSDGDALADHRESLRAVALAGGTEAQFQSGPDDLELAMERIVEAAHSCRVPIPSEIVGGWYSVWIGREWISELSSAQDCADKPGFWRIDPAVGDVVELCGSACEQLRQHGSVTIEENCVFPE